MPSTSRLIKDSEDVRTSINATEEAEELLQKQQDTKTIIGDNPALLENGEGVPPGVLWESQGDEELEVRSPDGGWGWMVVVAAFITNLIADGVTFTFGIIYVDLLKYFKEGKSKTAWIGGLFMAMPLLSGPIASYLTDRFGCRRVCICGAVLSAMGFIISSFAQSIELLIFTFGIVSGFGLALCYVAAVVIVAYYFDKRRSLATGLSVCGSGIGTFVFAPLSASLIGEYGWRGTTLILAGLFLNMAVCGALMRDLDWTRAKWQALRRDRQQRLRRKRGGRALRGGAKAAAEESQTSAQELRRRLLLQLRGDASGYYMNGRAMQQKRTGNKAPSDDVSRQFNSDPSLPTYISNGDKVHLGGLEILCANQIEYSKQVQEAESPLFPSQKFEENIKKSNNNSHTKDSLSDNLEDRESSLLIIPSTQLQSSKFDKLNEKSSSHVPDTDNSRRKSEETSRQKCTTQYLRNLQVHRHSLMYRGAVLKIRPHLKASSCPDIYRNFMAPIPEETKDVWFSFLWEIREVMADMVDFSHFSDVRFLFFSISNFILYSWYDVPYVFIADKAIEMGYSEPDASFLISILGVLNMLGVIVLGWAGDQPWVNAGLVYAACMVICGVVTGLIPLLSSYTGLCVVAGGFGLSISANYSLASIILVELITLDRFTNAYGLLLLVQGIANLIGPPMAGWLYDISGDYDISFYLAGLFIILCGVLLVVLPVVTWMQKFWDRQLKRNTKTSNGFSQKK